jgi:hypothetical protein
MPSVWSYEGTRLLVRGGAGMGVAVVRDRLELGGEVHAFDVQGPSAEGFSAGMRTERLDFSVLVGETPAA